MYEWTGLIEGKDITFQPNLKGETIIVKGMSSEEWEVFSSDPDFNWEMKHPFMLGETFFSREDYNSRLKEYCEKASDFLTKFQFVEQ